MRFLDTNVLLYSISTARLEVAKRDRAIAILEDDTCALSVQVLQEFYVQATRPTRCDALTHAVAAGLVRTWLRFRVQENTVDVLRIALEVCASHGFSYWDSAILAAAHAAGCGELLTEDLSHGQTILGVTVTNPFR